MVSNEDRQKRLAIMAIRENTPKQVEKEILDLISQGYSLDDLKKSRYAEHLTG